ncbi:hypothetical protein [Massilia sp. DWR3-1-1]|uniref:hypothetical protein n=1 Tax=Massilia sp. DWR3-1-1 TaxID=2804559 RepID=UPI003CE6BC19
MDHDDIDSDDELDFEVLQDQSMFGNEFMGRMFCATTSSTSSTCSSTSSSCVFAE